MAEKEKKSEVKKGDPQAPAPKSKLGIIGVVLVAIGLAWFVWETCLRPETDKERQERKDRERDEAQKKK